MPYLPCGTMQHHNVLIALSLLIILSPWAAGQDQSPQSAKGTIVAELGQSVMYVFQATNKDYWFGSNDRGVYRYDGKTLVNFTTKDGLCSNQIRGIQADKAGNLYFTTYEGISKFDGRSFTTLPVAATPPTAWQNRPEDLWFVGPQDAGVVFRYDGTALHRLTFPTTKLGDAHLARMPRSQFPNAIYSPYDVYCILKDSKGNLWFGTTCVGVCRYDGKTFAWLTDPTLTEAPVRSIHEDSKGNYWFTYSGHGSLNGFKAVDGMGKLQPGVQGKIIEGMSVLEDGQGKLWTAALRAGVFHYDGTRKVNYPIKEGTTAIEVFAMYKDRAGVLWLGTHNGGAYKYDGKAFAKFRP